MKINIKTGNGAAWRALYAFVNQHQIGRIVLDPTERKLNLALPVGWYTSCAGLKYPRLVEFSLRLPSIPWRWCMATNYARPVVWAYKTSSWFYHKLDGRYGWGGSCRKA